MRKLLILPLVLLPCLVHAMWYTQTLSLRTGYNAVVLRVTPADTRCSEVFKSYGILDVTWWNRDRRDDGSGIAPTAEMLIWYPLMAEASTFNRVLGGHAYIIHSSVDQEISITGVPARANSTIWLGEPNLVGLNLPDDTSGSYFHEYFAALEGLLAGDPFAVVNSITAGSTYWMISSPARSPNEAIWFTPSGSGVAECQGPLYVKIDTAENAILFRDRTDARRVTVKNVTKTARDVTFSLLDSATPPPGQGTKLGKVALMREDYDWTAGYPRRVYLPTDLSFTTNLAAGASFELAIRPDLDRMPAAVDGAYMGIIQISDGTTCCQRIGVSAAASLSAAKDPAGLWVGTVALSGVNHARQMKTADNAWDESKIEPVNKPFSFRLIVHVDSNGVARLLKDVYVATEADLDSTPTLLVSRQQAIAWRGGHPNAKIRRISSANFPNFGDPKVFTGSGFARGGTLTTDRIRQEYDDRTNPFVHAYHPQHDNLYSHNKEMMKYGEDVAIKAETDGTGTFESWPVSRTVTLEFAESDPTGSNYDWNRTVTGGIYHETITSLLKTEILVEGAFRLTKVVDTHILTGL